MTDLRSDSASSRIRLPWPRSLFGQILMALLLGLIAALALSFGLLLHDRAKFGDRLLGDYAAQRIAEIIEALDETPPVERRPLGRLLNAPPTRLLFRQPWRTPGQTPDEPFENAESSQFAERLRLALNRPIPIQVLAARRMGFIRRPDRTRLFESHGFQIKAPPWGLRLNGSLGHFHPRRSTHFLLIQARLSDGSVLTLRHELPPPMRWPLQTMGWLLLLGLVVMAIIGWAVRRLTRPLDALADATANLAHNLNQPPLPETGPTEVAKAARAFNQMQEEIRRMLESRAQALAGVSHDLRLPITRLRLRMAVLPDEQLKHKIEADLTAMDEMIGHTLAFLRAGTETEAMQRLDLNALLDALCDDMTLLGAIIRRAGVASMPIRARPQALQRALQNILDNARRYGGGVMDVLIEETETTIRLCVDDNGHGIPEAERERVFEPYVRLESSRARHTGGSGLGLAIARAIVRAHGGDIQIHPRPAGDRNATGTRVLIELPRGVSKETHRA